LEGEAHEEREFVGEAREEGIIHPVGGAECNPEIPLVFAGDTSLRIACGG
jgi:hypothetical protein